MSRGSEKRASYFQVRPASKHHFQNASAITPKTWATLPIHTRRQSCFRHVLVLYEVGKCAEAQCKDKVGFALTWVRS